MNLSKLRLNPRERVMAISICLAMAAGFYKLSHQKNQKQLKTIATSLSVAEVKLKERQGIVEDLHRKSTEALRSSGSSKKYSKYIEASKYLSSLIKNLGAKDGSEFDLNIISVEDHRKVQNFYKSTFMLEIDSSFISLGKFLEALGDSELLLDVKSVTLNRIDNDLRRCKATIQVDGYYQGRRG